MNKLIVSIIMILAITNGASANIKTDFFESLIKMGRGKVDDVVKHLPKPKNPKALREAIENVKIPKLKSAIKQIPEKAILANRAEKIIKKGNFEKKFFLGQKFDNQLAMMVQSSKYGDEYFTMAKKVSNISPDILTHNSNLVKYIPAGKLNPKTLQTKYIETLEKTGKWGWEKLNGIARWVAKHPKFSAASGAYAWYVLDPTGFDEQLRNSGKMLTAFLMDTVGSAAGGIGVAITEKTEEITDNIKKDIKYYVSEGMEDIKASSSYIVPKVIGILALILTVHSLEKT